MLKKKNHSKYVVNDFIKIFVSLLLAFHLTFQTFSIFNFWQISDLDLLMRKIENHFPNLRYLSLLGNKACPNQLSNPDNDDDDYQRYR